MSGAAYGTPGRPQEKSAGQLQGFESDGHRAEFAEHLRRRRLPLKFAYAGSSAATHDRLARSEGYQGITQAVEQEVRALLDGWPEIDNGLQFVELGPGNGIHTALFLTRLARERRPRRYLGLDFSSTLLSLALQRIRAEAPWLAVEGDLWDFEKERTGRVCQWREDGPLLAGLLGHTLGNPDAPDRVLSNVKDSLEPGDRLLLSIALRSLTGPEPDVLRPYRTVVFRNAALQPLRAAGLEGNADFDVRWTGDAVIGEVTVRRDCQVAGVSLTKGTVLECFHSRRYLLEEVDELLISTGWRPVAHVVDAAMAHAAVLADL